MAYKKHSRSNFIGGGGGACRGGSSFFVGEPPVSDVFLASTNHMMAFFYAHITCSLGSPGGGGGVKPYCLRLSLRQSAIGTYCVGLDIMMAFFYAH